VPPALKRRYEKIMVEDSGQENNDLTKAVDWCVKAGIEEVVIIGATGLREDHTLANISLLADYNRVIRAVMLTDTGSFNVYDHSVTISSHLGQQVSLFSLDPNLEISSAGLRYPLDKLRLHSWWRGTLNEADGEQFTLRFEEGQVILFMQYAPSL
jgi:thiamine pyrophosphokinase